MTADPWAFEVDTLLWLPIPNRPSRTSDLRERWLDAALGRAHATSIVPNARIDEWRAHLAQLFDDAPDGQHAVFFPVGLFGPTRVEITTRTGPQTHAVLEEWLDDANAEVDSTAVPAAKLADARLVMRVEEREGHTHYRVGLFGTDADLGVAMTAATPDPVIAGQLGEAGMTLLASFARAA